MAAASSAVEARSIEMIPPGERHGHPRGQFTLWFGANAQITAIVDGHSPLFLVPMPSGPLSDCWSATWWAVRSWPCTPPRDPNSDCPR